MDPTTRLVVLTWHQRLASGDNRRDAHWSKRKQRVTNERTAAALAWLEAGKPTVPAGATDVVFEFVRISPRRLDSADGLPSAFKAIKDELVERFGFDDDSDRQQIEFKYKPERGAVREHAVRVSIQWKAEER